MRKGFWAVLVTMACNPDTQKPGSGGQFGEENLGCVEIERVSVALDDASALGFDAQSVIDLTGSFSETLVYGDDSQSALALQVAPADGGVVELVSYQYFDESGQEIAMADCSQQIEIDVEVQAVSDDGVLDESVLGVLVAVAAGEASLFVELDPPGGDLDPLAYYEGENYDSVAVWLSVWLDESGASGDVFAQATSSEGDGDPDGTVSATSVTIAEF